MAIDTIKSSAITDGTISTGDIADDAITGVKLANDINIAGDLTVTGNDINTAGSMILRPGGAEKVRILSGGGITFNGDTAAANALDDYEEGTFTPSVGGNATYTSQIGKYVKIGNSVTIKLEMHINVLGTGSTSTVTGIPFAADTEAPLAVAKATNTSAAYGSIQARIAGSSLYYMTRQGNVSSQGTNTAIHGNNFLIQCSGSYVTG